MPMRWSVLCDPGTGIVLTVSMNVAAMVRVQEATRDSQLITSANIPNYEPTFWRRSFFLAHERAENYAKWTWSGKTRTFVRTKEEYRTKENIERSLLASAKLESYVKMMRVLNAMRQHVHTRLDLQETVYLTKKAEALRFKSSGYDESTIMEVPYVLHYADLLGISLKQAADDILFKAKLSDEVLAKTELMRMKFFRKVRDAHSREELPVIMGDFDRQYFKNVLS